MASREYGRGLRAALVLLSRGVCYAPDCLQRVVVKKHGKYVVHVDIAHIRALEVTGPRYDPEFLDPNDPSNLMLLCRDDHKLIDHIEPEKYSVGTLLKWKSDREVDGDSLFVGLENLTESRLQELIDESIKAVTEGLDSALDRFAQIDSEAADLLRVLRNELLDASVISTVDPDSVTLLYDAARQLGDLGDNAALLRDAARDLVNLESAADRLCDAARDLQDLPDAAAALQRVVDDWKRNRPDY